MPLVFFTSFRHRPAYVPQRFKPRLLLWALQAVERKGDERTPYFPFKIAAPKAVLHRACERLGIDPKISIHDLRRTFATRCAQAGMYPAHLQKILGHAKLETTMKYYVHLDRMSTLDALMGVNL